MIPMSAPTVPFRRAAELLRQASDPTRLAVLLLLARVGERNVSAMLAELGGASQPALSHHLAILRLGRLVEPRRRGRQNVYALTAAGRALAAAAGKVVA
jgi:DNA-binding transcriptional ArsR family regulator